MRRIIIGFWAAALAPQAAWLGATLKDDSNALLVADAPLHSTAQVFGLRSEDQIQRVNGQAVRNAKEVRALTSAGRQRFARWPRRQAK